MPNELATIRARRTMFYVSAVACVACAYFPRVASAQISDDGIDGVHAAEDSPAQSTSAPAEKPAEPLPKSARDDPTSPAVAKAFGDSGVAVINGSLGVNNVTFSNSDASQFSVFAEPGLDYFIGRPVSLGGYFLVSYSDQKGYDYFGPLLETKETGYGFGGRIGINVALGKFVSVWPKLGLGITHYNTRTWVLTMPPTLVTNAPNQLERSSHAFWIDLYVPVLFHPVPHFFFGLGPSIFADLSRSATFSGARPIDNKRTGMGLTLTTGGWL